MNRRIRAFFDKHAPAWDDGVSEELLARLADIMSGLDIRPGDRVLDVGCGTGVLLQHLYPRIGPDGRIVAVDLSFDMLARARAKRGGAPTLFLQADVSECPFVPGWFDLVVCYSVFPHFLDQGRAVAALASMLKPGGRLVVCHSKSREDINDFHDTVGEVVGGHYLPEEPAMRGLLEGAGLNVMRFDALSDRYVVVSGKPA